MSGFVAIVDTSGAPIDRDLLEKLTDSLKCRGPDRQGVRTDGPVGLGHTLFRTTFQAQHENQPASIDGQVWITGSIRVDAREALVADLAPDVPISLQTTPDSELVLQAYRKWGENCLDHLLGDFAFALWDSRSRKLFCARDRFGMRQLYHARVGSSVVVSNSLYCMRQHPGISDALDDQAIADFLLFGDHIWTDKTQTSFRDIRTLAPAHKLVISGDATSIDRFWDLPTDTPLLKYSRDEDYIEHFRSVFAEAVEDRMRCDEVVLAMSGGMDSSAIASTVNSIRQRGNRDTRVNALTIVFDSVHPCQERHYSSLVAEHLDIPIHYIVADPHLLLAPVVRWTRPMERYQPSLRMEFNRKALQLGRVLLTGSAGDNLLHYSPNLPTLMEANPLSTLRQIFQLKARYGRMPGLGTGLKAWVRRKAGKTRLNSPPYPYPPWLNKDLENRFEMMGRWDAFWASYMTGSKGHPRHPRLYESLMSPGWNTDDIEMNGNLTTCEERDPYLDLRLVEFVLSLPPMPWLYEKHILRQSARSTLPKAVIERPKQLLGTVASSLFEQACIDDYLASHFLINYVDEAVLRKTTANERGKPGMDYLNLRPLILGQWLQMLELNPLL